MTGDGFLDNLLGDDFDFTATDMAVSALALGMITSKEDDDQPLREDDAIALARMWMTQHDRAIRTEALRAAAEKWKPYTYERRGGIGPASIAVARVRFCPTCENGRSRETSSLVCQTCGHDYGADDG